MGPIISRQSTGSGKGFPHPAIPLLFHENPASRTSVIDIPHSVSFPMPHSVPNFGESRYPGSSQLTYPANVYSNHALFFGQIPYPSNVFILGKYRIPTIPPALDPDFVITLLQKSLKRGKRSDLGDEVGSDLFPVSTCFLLFNNTVKAWGG